MEGIINVRKERGFTSFDVVAVLRGILHEKRIGHAGTLDPDAEGVLVVCAGHATRLVDQITAEEKIYETVLRLGITTDTQDMTGTVLTSSDVSVDEETVRAAVKSFEGPLFQVPPMYSAVKINGKKLYEIARSGREVERKPRSVRIHEIRIERIDLPDVYMTVRCSKGTYIRTLCHDIGEKIGCGGAMASLKRTRSGHFSIEDGWTLDEIRSEMRRFEDDPGAGSPRFLLTLDECFREYPAVTVSGRDDMLVRNGNPVRFKVDAPMARVYLSDGRFAGVYEYAEDKKYWKPWKMFISAEQNGKKNENI